MLLVDTYLNKSNIAGIGLFAGQDIIKGTIIWRLNPLIDISFKTLDSLNLSSQTREQFESFTYYDKNNDCYILCGDNARFWNHSDSPNCDEPNGNGPSDITTANRDIKIGEELTIDYRLIHTGDLGF